MTALKAEAIPNGKKERERERERNENKNKKNKLKGKFEHKACALQLNLFQCIASEE